MALNLMVSCSRSYSKRIIFAGAANQRLLNTHVKQYGQSLKKPDEQQRKTEAVKFYLLGKLLDHIKKDYLNLNVFLRRKFPTAVETYQVFTEGVKVFYADLKYFIKIMRLIYSNPPTASFEKLNRRELELYNQLPKDIFKVTPVILFAALPFALYIVLPLIYYYPRQMLTSHFWTLQQKSEFKVMILKERLLHNKPVFRHLQLQLNTLKGRKYHNQLALILGQLGSGQQPTIEQILEVKPLFSKLPFKLNYLSGNHVKHLSKLHNGLFFLRRMNLKNIAIVLQAMDKAIMKEGGVHNMPVEALRNACFIRGLNPSNMKTEDMIDWMKQWIKISENVTPDCYSLLLHCPILLGYNQPSNWALIYPYKE